MPADDLFEDELVDLTEDAKKVTRARKRAPGQVAAVVSPERLLEPSPTPFRGQPDPKYSELDCQDHLYLPRYLIREWGIEKWEASAYLSLWRSEAGRRERLLSDFKGNGKKAS